MSKIDKPKSVKAKPARKKTKRVIEDKIEIEAVAAVPVPTPAPVADVVAKEGVKQEVKEVSKEAVKEAPKTHIYRGESVEVKDLAGMKLVPVQIEENNVPLTKSKWNTIGGVKLPKLAIITDVQESIAGKDARLVSYTDYLHGFRLGSANLPVNHKFKKLLGTQGKTMLQKFNQYRIDNLGRNVSLGMTIGSRPEIFVEDDKGQIIPAFTFLGPKNKPTNTSELVPHFAYWNGFSAEFTTSAPGCLAYHVDSVQLGIKAIIQAARKVNKKAKLSWRNVIQVPTELFDATNDEHIALDCAPVFNAYGRTNKTLLPRELLSRSTGGHIHFGIGKTSKESADEMVKTLDAILAVSCVPLFARFDNPARRIYFGSCGDYRLPKHGIEYRVLSNAWMLHPAIMNLVFDFGRKVLAFGKNGLRSYWESSEEETIDVVNNCDADRAKIIMERNKPIVMNLLKAACPSYNYTDDRGAKRMYQILQEGIESVVKDPTDIEGAWMVDGKWIQHCEAPNRNWHKALTTIISGKQI